MKFVLCLVPLLLAVAWAADQAQQQQVPVVEQKQPQAKAEADASSETAVKEDAEGKEKKAIAVDDGEKKVEAKFGLENLIYSSGGHPNSGPSYHGSGPAHPPESHRPYSGYESNRPVVPQQSRPYGGQYEHNRPSPYEGGQRPVYSYPGNSGHYAHGQQGQRPQGQRPQGQGPQGYRPQGPYSGGNGPYSGPSNYDGSLNQQNGGYPRPGNHQPNRPAGTCRKTILLLKIKDRVVKALEQSRLACRNAENLSNILELVKLALAGSDSRPGQNHGGQGGYGQNHGGQGGGGQNHGGQGGDHTPGGPEVTTVPGGDGDETTTPASREQFVDFDQFAKKKSAE